MTEDPAASDALAASADDPVEAGHFTTMQMRAGRVQGRDLHLLRLRQASEDLWGIGTDKGRLLRGIRTRCLQHDHRADRTLRVCVRPVGEGASPGDEATGSPFRYGTSVEGDPVGPLLRVDVELGPPRTVPATPLRLLSHRGLRARPLVKHLALQAQFAMRAQAQAAGFDDALLVSPDGRVAEGSFWNIAFWDGRTVTWPRAATLPGVTWRLLEGALAQAGVPQQRVPVPLEESGAQRAAFAVNSSGIRAIASIDDRLLPGDAAFQALLRSLLDAVPWDDL